MLANTIEVRAIAKAVGVCGRQTWTDKCGDPAKRRVTFQAYGPESLKDKMIVALRISGFDNKVKVTTSKAGYSYLRIEAAF